MGLVHQHNDVRAFVEPAPRLGEFVDGGDQHLAHILPEQRLQFQARGHAHHVRHVGGIEGGGDLCVQVDAVHHNQYGGIAQFRVHPQFQRGKDHQQRLAAALKMPNQPLFRISCHHAVHDLVGGEILLVTADELDAAVFLVGGKDSEVLQDVEHHLGPQHIGNRRLDVVKLAFLLVFLVAPRSPDVDGHADGAIAVIAALGGEGEDIRHEHGRCLFLVNLVDLKRAVEPGHRAARRCLGLADNQWQAINDKHHVKALFHRPGLVNPLVAYRQPIVGGFGGIHQAHGDMLAVVAERHGFLATQPSHEILVGPHQPVGLHGQNAGT